MAKQSQANAWMCILNLKMIHQLLMPMPACITCKLAELCALRTFGDELSFTNESSKVWALSNPQRVSRAVAWLICRAL